MKSDSTQIAQFLVNSLPDAAICINKDLTIVALNPELAKLYGSACNNLHLRPVTELLVTTREKLQSALKQKPSQLHCRLFNRQLEQVDVSLLISKISLPGLDNHLLLAVRPTSNETCLPEKVLQAAIDNMSVGVFISVFNFDGEGRHGQFVAVNNTACKHLGYRREELVKMNARSINPPGNTETISAIGRTLKRDGKHSFNAIHVGKDGAHHPVHVDATIIKVDKQHYVLSQVKYEESNITVYNIAESRFGRLLELSWDEIYVFDTNTLYFSQANTGALNNLGYSRQEIANIKITDLLEDISENTFRRLTEPLFDGSKTQIILESIFKRKDGSTYPVEIRLQLSHSEVPPVFLANIQDITQRKETETNLLYLAHHDTLTGLYNRNTFIKHLEHEIDVCSRSETLMAVMFLDLDGFKYINDTMGHDAGDQLLMETARRLEESTRSTDTVARQGGDEFTIILTNVRHTEAIRTIAQKIIDRVAEPYHIFNQQVQTSCSIGITVYPFTESDNAYLLIKQADTAMYQAKNKGKNTYSFYTASLAEDELTQRELENCLTKAFDNNEFEIYYQPKVDLKTHNISGGEALIRWHNALFPDISPMDFIPLLEKNGLICRLDFLVLQQTCLNLKKWLQHNPGLVLSVNLSARHFNNDSLVHDIKMIIDNTGVSARNLEIEITEGVLIEKAQKAEIILNELKNIGLNISLDDFGSGYSSLSYLKQLPINRLKIDRTFVIDIDNNRDSKTIIEAIINLAESLELSVIAEGIENEQQAEILRSMNCQEGQGYLYGKPCPADEFFELITSAYPRQVKAE